MWLTPMGIVANPMPSGWIWPRSSGAVVTVFGSLVHPLEEREPYRDLNVEHRACVGEVTADLGDLEPRDPLKRGVGAVYGLVDGCFDGGALSGDVDGLPHRHRDLLRCKRVVGSLGPSCIAVDIDTDCFPLIGTGPVG